MAKRWWQKDEDIGPAWLRFRMCLHAREARPIRGTKLGPYSKLVSRPYNMCQVLRISSNFSWHMRRLFVLRWSLPAPEIIVVGATHGFDERFPVETVQRAETIHENFEERVRFADAKEQFASFDDPEDVFNKRTLIGCFDSDLVEFVNL